MLCMHSTMSARGLYSVGMGSTLQQQMSQSLSAIVGILNIANRYVALNYDIAAVATGIAYERVCLVMGQGR